MNERPLVQWSFLQYKKTQKKGATPVPCFLHSATQIGSKILIFGGCDYYGEALNQLFLYDTASFQWVAPGSADDFQEDHPGCRYGHSATLIEMHPPKIMVWGGMLGGGTFEFDQPDTAEDHEAGDDSASAELSRSFMRWRRKGKKARFVEEQDDAIYFLELTSDRWIWSKPLVHGTRTAKPPSRGEHSACKTNTNEITIFGGWTHRPMNDMWTFNYVDCEWRQVSSSGIQPRARFRHTAEVIGGSMFILGGSETIDDVADGSRHLSLHELNLNTMQWSHPALRGGSPFPRSGHGSAVIGANSIAVFGGKRSNEVTGLETIYCNLFMCVDLCISGIPE